MFAPIHSNSVRLDDLIKTDNLSKIMVKEMIDFASRTNSRIRNEKDIAKILELYLKETDTTLKFVPFGSSTYGFGGSKTNFNILVNASKHFPIWYKN